MMTHPKARQDNLVVQELFDELVVYDLARDQVHSLNPTAAQVWQGCDGQTSPAQLAGRLQPELAPAQAEALVWLALDRLGQADLLEQKVVRPGGLKISRRQALRALGISALLLPVVASLAAPAAAQNWTCAGSIIDFELPAPPAVGSIGDSCETTLLDLNAWCAGACASGAGYALLCEDEGGSYITKIWCCCL